MVNKPWNRNIYCSGVIWNWILNVCQTKNSILK